MQAPHGIDQNLSANPKFKRPRRLSGFAWISIVLAGLFAVGALVTALRKQRPANSSVQTRANAEMNFGVEEFTDAPDGGVTFSRVAPPDSPADKAGLVGGDILINIDGHEVRNTSDMLDLLRQLPVGKNIEVNYVRDGEAKRTRLTTISAAESQQLTDKFESRPVGHGALGFVETERVQVDGSNISGVRVGKLSASGPAILAGIQEGDIIISFDGVPIRGRMEFLLRVRRAIPYSTVKVLVIRGSERLEIPVKIGKR